MNNLLVNSWSDSEFSINKILDDVPDDIFISCISYEPRTTGILKKLNRDYSAQIGIFIINEEFKKSISIQNKIETFLNTKNYFERSVSVTSSIDNPIKLIMDIDKLIRDGFPENQNINITLDMTTFPRSELLTILYYLRHHSKVNYIRILYTSPIQYGSWLTEGYRYTSTPSFFEGPITFERKTALIILTGFELTRAISMIDDVEPSYLILGNANPGTAPEFRDKSQEIVNNLKLTRRITTEILDVPANNPYLCKNFISNFIDMNSKDYSFFVAPMGPKLGVLGTYLAYEERQNFRVLYSVPLAYNIQGYSSGCRDIYQILLDKKQLRA